MNSIDWKPVTLEECFKALDEVLGMDERIKLSMMPEADLILCHHALGQWIRNSWDLWKGGPLLDHMLSLGFKHPDDISMTIIREWWRRMNGKPSVMQQEIAEYAAYWEKQK